MDSKTFLHPTTNTLVVENYDELNNTPVSDDEIFLITQFHIPENPRRAEEIRFCIRRNLEIEAFSKIILINEREYSPAELGINPTDMSRVIQVNSGKRLTFRAIFSQILESNIHGYVAFANSDIFFDESIKNIRYSCLSETRSVYALLRYEFDQTLPLNKCKLFAFSDQVPYRYDSQDAWIIHTNQLDAGSELLKNTNFELGIPCCDNRLAYLLHQDSYTCYNVPGNVRIYHYHTSNFRQQYDPQQRIARPHMYIQPAFGPR